MFRPWSSSPGCFDWLLWGVLAEGQEGNECWRVAAICDLGFNGSDKDMRHSKSQDQEHNVPGHLTSKTTAKTRDRPSTEPDPFLFMARHLAYLGTNFLIYKVKPTKPIIKL